MDLGVGGRTALVLAGSGGLGSAAARALAREGVNVALAGRDIEKLDRTVAAVELLGVRAFPLLWDLSDLSVIPDRIGSVEKALGPIDILVNMTGGPAPTPASGQPASVWGDAFQSMVLSVIATTDAVLPRMREKRWGRILTSTSSGVLAPLPNLGISNTLRMSLLGWSKSLAREVGADGITANIVVPGRISTARTQFLDEQKALREGDPLEEVTKASRAGIPLGRYGEPNEYGDVIAFLASDRASYITGSVIRVDGGLISGI